MKIGIVGLGTFGTLLVRELAEIGVEVLAVDNREDCVDAVKDDAAFAGVLDVTDPAALARLPIGELDAVVVTIGEDFRSAMIATAHLLQMKPRRLVCRAGSKTHAQLLRALRVEEIIEPEAVAASRVASSLALKGVTGSYELTERYRIIEVVAPARIVGRSLVALDLRKNHELNLVTVKRRDPKKDRIFAVGVPAPDLVFAEGDILVLFGMEAACRRFVEA
jgi:trk system potassium uptake protein TrkA